MKQQEVLKTVVQTTLVVAGGLGAGYLYQKLAGDSQTSGLAPWLVTGGGIGLAVLMARNPALRNIGIGVAATGGTVLVQRMLNLQGNEQPISGLGTAYYTDAIGETPATPLLLPDLGEPVGRVTVQTDDEPVEQYL